jgi:hypothetical protein
VLSAVSAAQIGTTPNTNSPVPPPVTMRFTVDRTGVQRYQWRSRDGSHCQGRIPTAGPGRPTRCSWT